MATHTLLILYNGTDSFYDRDINIPYNPAERFEFGEIVSRVGHHAQMTALNGKAGEDRHVAGASTGGSCDLSVLRVNGVSDETHKGGTALGRGMEENVQLGMQEIKRKRKQYNNDIVVVAMGWSRGGIT